MQTHTHTQTNTHSYLCITQANLSSDLLSYQLTEGRHVDQVAGMFVLARSLLRNSRLPPIEIVNLMLP